MLEKISSTWSKCVTWLREKTQWFVAWIYWLHINYVRVVKGCAHNATLTDISVLYCSENFLVVNKHQDVKINSNNPGDKVTVETQLRHMYPGVVDDNTVHGFRFIHRLDYSTSGALCLGLNKKAARWGHKAFRNRYVTKHYLALVRGHVTNKVKVIDIGIGVDTSVMTHQLMCVATSPTCADPRPALTNLFLLERGLYDGQPASKVLLIPHTGRSHQLRVHCHHISHTIVGDYSYSQRKDVKPYRMMLHSYKLVVPMKYEHIDVTAPDPFVTQRDAKWKCTEVIESYNNSVQTFLQMKVTTDS